MLSIPYYNIIIPKTLDMSCYIVDMVDISTTLSKKMTISSFVYMIMQRR